MLLMRETLKMPEMGRWLFYLAFYRSRFPSPFFFFPFLPRTPVKHESALMLAF